MSDAASQTEPTVPDLECDLLVLGASFTGIEVLHQLRRGSVLGTIDIIVVDARSSHGYIPLVHEVVAGEVEPAKYVLPTAEYVRSLPRATYLVDVVVAVDASKREVTLASGRTIGARAIVLALGSQVELPPSLGNADSIPSAKFLDQCQALRTRLNSLSPGRLTVIGGGITGVEMAGELAVWCKRNNGGFSVTLVEMRKQLLTTAGRAASKDAYSLLRQLGVEIVLDVQVTSIDEHRVTIVPNANSAAGNSGPRVLDCALVVWAGGIRPAAVTHQLGVYLGDDGFIQVDDALRCFNPAGVLLPGVFAGGDAVRVVDHSGRWPTMQRAIECIWQGKVLARNVSAVLRTSPESGAASQSSELVRHRLVRDFPYGISIGTHSLVLYGRLVVNLRAIGVAFRRWLMRRYIARYRPRSR